MIVEAGFDALSLTALEGGETSALLEELYDAQFRANRAAGNDIHEIAPSGYRGNHCGHVFLGRNGLRVYYQAKARDARDAADILRAHNAACRPTRIDVQATFRPDCTEREACRRYHAHVNRASADKRAQHPRSGVIHQNPDLGNSYYLRNLRGDSVFRTYNKHRESPADYPVNTWRHEWQVGGRRAVSLWNKWEHAGTQAELAIGTVRGFLLKCGLDEPDLRGAEVVDVVKGKHQSDTERRLQWFNTSVLPTVQKLYDAGIPLETLVTLMSRQVGESGWYFRRAALEKSACVKPDAATHRETGCQHSALTSERESRGAISGRRGRTVSTLP